MNNRIKKAIIQAIRETAKNAFDLSQKKVPVVTGFLKNSGSFTETETGAKIRYSAKYASIVEKGYEGGVQYVEGHTRGDGKYVRSYSRTMPKREGTFFIEKSVKEAFNEFPKILEARLKS